MTKLLFLLSCLRIAGFTSKTQLSDIRKVWMVHANNCTRLGVDSRVKRGGKITEIDTSNFSEVKIGNTVHSVADVQEYGEMLSIYDRENTPARYAKANARALALELKFNPPKKA